MDSKNNMAMQFMQVPEAPPASHLLQAPPMYPTIETDPYRQLPPLVFFNGTSTEPFQKQEPSSVPQSRPTSYFILNEKTPVGPEPLKMHCPHCNTMQTSKVVSKLSLKSHFAALLCCVFGLVCLIPIPYCMNAFRNLHHYCNNCGQYLGSYPAK